MKCVAIDDEPLALEVISKFCRRIGGMEVSVFVDPEKGLHFIQETAPELVFLDIEMENVSGLDIARRLPENTCFIFTTAYLDYALDGFELDAVDYLHKPFPFDRFRAAYEKALRRIAGINLKANAEEYIVVKQEYNNVRIPLADILYIEAMEGYSKIFKVSGGCVVSRILLKKVMDMLPDKGFLRIHRSFVVPTSKIESYSKQSVRLIGGKTLPVGRQYASEIGSNI